MLHPCICSLLFGAHLNQSLLQVTVTHSLPLMDTLCHTLHLTLLWLQTMNTLIALHPKTLINQATANGRSR
jgi:hypothetical protein